MKYLVFSALALMTFFGATEKTATTDLESEVEILNDSLTANWEAHIASIMKDIAGKEGLPADSVYTNLQIPMFKGMPADRMLNVMKFGFSRSLGVTCEHCHNPEDWSSDELTPKASARDMWAMVGRINTELLQEVDGLTGRQVFVNCTTCHRGEVVPAHNFE